MANRPSKPSQDPLTQARGGDAARRKSAAFRVREAQRVRRRRATRWAAVITTVLAVAGIVIVVATMSGKSAAPTASNSDAATTTLTGPPGPEGIVLEQGTPLAASSTAATGQTVDGIECNSMEQAVYHIHIHLSIYVDGSMRPVPAGIGVVEPVAQQTADGVFDQASRCYYWLHTHAQDGIIHVEAPNEAVYTLGQFFNIWRQPLSPSQIGPQHGAVTAYVDGKTYRGNPATITLTSHEDIQLDLGTPTVTPRKVDWSHAQL
jgi:hypothetical protein